CRRRSIPRAGSRRTFYGDLHPLDTEHDLSSLAGVCEVNDYPVLVAHGGDVTAACQDSARADGRVRAAEVLDLGQVVDVADRIGAADAHLTDGESIHTAGILFPLKAYNAPSPTITDARGDRGRVHLEGSVRLLCRR